MNTLTWVLFAYLASSNLWLPMPMPGASKEVCERVGEMLITDRSGSPEKPTTFVCVMASEPEVGKIVATMPRGWRVER